MKQDKIEDRQKVVEENLKRYSNLDIEELFKEYKTSYSGISIVELDDRLEEYGKNIIDTKNNNSLINRLKEAFINPFNMVLILVAIITFITDVVIPTKKDYATFILIVATVIISAIISFIQQVKSDKAAKKLQKMISNKIDVIRDDVLSIVDDEDIVPGDIVKLSSGDMLPGDVRFLTVKDLFIDQASLTGESNPVEKFAESKGNEGITDISNIGFMGTNIVSRNSNSNRFSYRK